MGRLAAAGQGDGLAKDDAAITDIAHLEIHSGREYERLADPVAAPGTRLTGRERAGCHLTAVAAHADLGAGVEGPAIGVETRRRRLYGDVHPRRVSEREDRRATTVGHQQSRREGPKVGDKHARNEHDDRGMAQE